MRISEYTPRLLSTTKTPGQWRVATSSVVPQRPSSMGKGDAGDDNNDDKKMF